MKDALLEFLASKKHVVCQATWDFHGSLSHNAFGNLGEERPEHDNLQSQCAYLRHVRISMQQQA